MGVCRNILVAFDQLGNTFAGGNPDNTISSRIGYYNYAVDTVMPQWLMLRAIVDLTFYPVDGLNHCKGAYYSDSGEDFDQGTSNWMIAVLAIIVVSFCFVIGIILHLLFIIGAVSPKKVTNEQKVYYKLNIAQRKFRGVSNDLDKDEELANKIYQRIPKARFSDLSKMMTDNGNG